MIFMSLTSFFAKNLRDLAVNIKESSVKGKNLKRMNSKGINVKNSKRNFFFIAIKLKIKKNQNK